MNKKTGNYIVIFIFCFVVALLINKTISQASSAEVIISADKKELTIGENIFVYITLNSDTPIGDFEANLIYDDDILEYVSRVSKVTGSSGFLKFSDIDITQESNTRKYTLKFEAKKVGTCTIKFNERPMVYDMDTGLEMSVSSNVLYVEVKPLETASDNAKLKSLKISPSELDPTFDSKVLEYNTKVGYEVQKLIVNAVQEDAKAKVSIKGNENLKEGENKVVISVVAESGAIIKYTINVTKEAAPLEDNNTEEPTTEIPENKQSAFELIRKDGEIYAIYSGTLKIVEPGAAVVIPTGYIRTKAIISDISVTVYALEKDLGNDFILLYAMNGNGEAGFYQYDRSEKTIQRFITSTPVISDNIDPIKEDDTIIIEKYRNNLNVATIIITILVGFCTILTVLLIRFYMKSKGFKEEELD